MQMVNVGFPDPAVYGFERVDAAAASGPGGTFAINRKFTPNQIIRILGEFSAF